MHICSLANPFPFFFHSVSPTPRPSDSCQLLPNIIDTELLHVPSFCTYFIPQPVMMFLHSVACISWSAFKLFHYHILWKTWFSCALITSIIIALTYNIAMIFEHRTLLQHLSHCIIITHLLPFLNTLFLKGRTSIFIWKAAKFLEYSRCSVNVHWMVNADCHKLFPGPQFFIWTWCDCLSWHIKCFLTC